MQSLSVLLFISLALLPACASSSHPGVQVKETAIRTPFDRPQTIQRPLPEYPEQARVNRIEGQVLCRGKLSPRGKLEQITITDSTPQGVFDAAASAVAEKIVFAIPPGWMEAHPGFELSIQIIFEFEPCGHIPYSEQAQEKIRVCLQGAPRFRR